MRCNPLLSSAISRPRTSSGSRGKIDETGAFLDPLIVVRGEDGRLWTPEWPPSARRRESARPAADHRAHLAERVARLSHPRAQHREGAQPQGSQPRGDPHGAQSRQTPAAGARSAAGGGIRSAGAADARHSLQNVRRASPAAPTARSSRKWIASASARSPRACGSAKATPRGCWISTRKSNASSPR